ncbi:hypothetical protein [[Clostridium] hylemonae]|uniref:DUF4203 domain-containing protein n=1 Tax=[Clostridium] hylemonae DSM 15053 TaxID=553973 RepID=C0BZG9_9FIRM|nr:hypothetical protein [[Clostridium] hylemonae]EEG74547.1 hypothetical protein CLOHYLEM_05209 [[Clostridium] hylemonae DSM 15053]QEK18579.1 hypothetical protein LAJLEIBI_02597 [[Clostridium] hylemonae DSM 15053]
MEMVNLNDIIGNALDGTSKLTGSGAVQGTTALIVAAAIGILVCLFGLKLVKILTAAAGAVIGAGIGVSVAVGLGLTKITFLAVVIAGAVILGAMAFFLYKFGVFLMVLAYVFGVCAMLLKPDSLIPLIISIAVAVVFAVLAVIFIEPLVIIVTGLSGGVSAGVAAAELAGLAANAWIGFGIGIVMAVIGISVQFMMHSRKIGKTEKVHAKKYKEQVSRETEVEKARMILDDDAEEKEDDED